MVFKRLVFNLIIGFLFCLGFGQQIIAQDCAFAGNDTIVCGLFTTLEANLTGTWAPLCDSPDGLVVLEEFPPSDLNITVSNSGIYDFIFTSTDPACVDQDTVSVNFIVGIDSHTEAFVSVEIIPDPDFSCIGGGTYCTHIISFDNGFGNPSYTTNVTSGFTTTTTSETTTVVGGDGCEAGSIVIDTETDTTTDSDTESTSTNDSSDLIEDALTDILGIGGGGGGSTFFVCDVDSTTFTPDSIVCVMDTSYYLNYNYGGGEWAYIGSNPGLYVEYNPSEIQYSPVEMSFFEILNPGSPIADTIPYVGIVDSILFVEEWIPVQVEVIRELCIPYTNGAGCPGCGLSTSEIIYDPPIPPEGCGPISIEILPCTAGPCHELEACSDGDPCTINDEQGVSVIDGSICIPCEGIPVGCEDGSCSIVSPCDDGDPLTENDTEEIAYDGSLCQPCGGTPIPCVSPLPPIINVGGVPACIGETVFLNATAEPGVILDWFNDFGDFLGSGPDLNFNVDYDFPTVSVIATNPADGCTSGPVFVTIETIPFIWLNDFSYTGIYCNNDGPADPTYSIDGFADFIAFTSSDSGLALDQFSGIIDIQASLPGSYDITLEVGDFCSFSALSTTVDILAVPISNFDYPITSFCESEGPQTPSVNVDFGNYSFSADNGLAIDSSTGTIDPSGSPEGTYTITLSNDDPCSSPVSNQIDIIDCPSVCPTVTTPIMASRSFCEGGVTNLGNLEPELIIDDPSGTAGEISWYETEEFLVEVPAVLSFPSLTCEVFSQTYYAGLACTVDPTVIISAGSCSIEVYPNPNSAAPIGGCSYEVVDNCGDVLVIEYSTDGIAWDTAIPPVTDDGSSVNWRAYAAGCPDNDGNGSPDCIQIGSSVAECPCIPPAWPVAVVDELFLCDGQITAGSFEVSLQADASAFWYNEAGDQVGTGPNFEPTEPGVYYVEAFTLSDTCQSGQIEATLFEMEAVTPPTIASLNICETELGSTAFEANIGTAVTVNWYAEDSQFLASGISYTPTEAGTYIAESVSDIGCNSEAVTITLTVAEEMILTTISDTTITAGESIQLWVEGGTDYIWETESSLSCTECPNPIASPLETTTYTVSSTDPCANQASTTITVIVENISGARLIVPNAFSPNDDGINDVYRVLASGDLAFFDFYVVNRWGEIVFETDDINQGWNGVKENEEQHVGTYAYIVLYQFEGGFPQKISGNVSLVR